MANKQSSADKTKPIVVSFPTLMKMGLSSKTEWPGKFREKNCKIKFRPYLSS